MVVRDTVLAECYQGKVNAKDSLFSWIWCRLDPDDNYVYLGGCGQLTVIEVNGPVRIHEYDGAESVEEQNDFTDWL